MISLPKTVDLRSFYSIIKSALSLQAESTRLNENRSEDDTQAIFDMWAETHTRDTVHRYESIIGQNLVHFMLLSENPVQATSPKEGRFDFLIKQEASNEIDQNLMNVLKNFDIERVHWIIQACIDAHQVRDAFLQNPVLSDEDLRKYAFLNEQHPMWRLDSTEQTLGHGILIHLERQLEKLNNTTEAP